ncbi:MAG TPA: FKBP-type peptidyl-prolyl cis-trans isomerase [Cyclobacteriaceae bacterium]|nr:FKBP-type peptidyl-prolyl cis-trans isomerase [Cyclobacteriaceae bacterium]
MKRLLWFLTFVVIGAGCSKTDDTLTAAEQLVYDVNIIDEYLAENSINAIKLESGVRYIITEMGTGPNPTKDHCVTFNYTGYVLYTAEPFESNTGYKTPLKANITGMQIGLKLLPVGSKGSLFIPSGLAYAGNSSATIPRNANLRFDVEVVSITDYNALAGYCK